MKRMVLSIFIFLFLLSGAYTLALDNLDELNKLGLTNDQIRKIMDINMEVEKVKKQARLELNILETQLEKLLADVDPDMNQVEKLLRDSMEWKVKSELAKIKKKGRYPENYR